METMADKQEEVLLSEFSDDAATEADAESQMSLNINPPGEGTTWDKKARYLLATSVLMG